MMLLGIDLTFDHLILILITGLLVGMAKVGIPGLSLAVVPILALAFGGKSSTGILLPMLIMADVFGVSYYHRHANWQHVLRALPWAVVGVLFAMVVGRLVNDRQFKTIIAFFIFFSVVLMLWRDLKKKSTEIIPDNRTFAATMGFLGGFATMIGNAAGPIFAIYLLALKLEKNQFIGTTAWFFLIINLFKFPLHLFVWKTIHLQTLAYDLMALPMIALGAFLGIAIVKKISNRVYRWFIIIVTIVSALLMLI